MTAKSFCRGHPTIWLNEIQKWVYEDTKESINDVIRPCVQCGAIMSDDIESDGAIDFCLGKLEGVISACCGHGIVEEAYISFDNGLIIRGFEIFKEER